MSATAEKHSKIVIGPFGKTERLPKQLTELTETDSEHAQAHAEHKHVPFRDNSQ